MNRKRKLLASDNNPGHIGRYLFLALGGWVIAALLCAAILGFYWWWVIR